MVSVDLFLMVLPISAPVKDMKALHMHGDSILETGTWPVLIFAGGLPSMSVRSGLSDSFLTIISFEEGGIRHYF